MKKTTQRCIFGLWIIALAVYAIMLPCQTTAAQAKTAKNFLYFMGTNGARVEWIPEMIYTGAHVFRGSMNDSANNVTIAQKTKSKVVLFTACGGVAPDPALVVAEAKKLVRAGVLMAVEAPNEPRNWPITYQGQTMDSTNWMPLALWQKDVYAAMKADPEVANIPVLTTSFLGDEGSDVGLQFLTIPTPVPAGVLMPAGTQYADQYNAHYGWPYFKAWGNDSESYAYSELCFTDSYHGNHYAGYPVSALTAIPKVCTEFGWANPDAAAYGKQIINTFFDMFANGWLWALHYVIFDQDGYSGTHALYNNDHTPKASAAMLHNLVTILADTQEISTPGAIGYTIPGQAAATHDLLLQKSSGRFDLALWDERDSCLHVKPWNFDTCNLLKSPLPPVNVTVNLGVAHTNVNVYDPTTGTAPVQALGTVSSVTLAQTDHVQIIEFDANADASFPYCDNPGGIFLDSVQVKLAAAGSGVVIRYTTDGTTPTASSAQYTAPLTIKTTCALKAVGFAAASNSAVSATYFKIIGHVPLPAAKGLFYKYYEYNAPAWDSLTKHPLAVLTPVKTGTVDSFTLGMKNRDSLFAVHFQGVIQIDTPGVDTFLIYSDAGAKLYIDNFLVVNNDGPRAYSVASAPGTIQLTKGPYRISVDYFQDTGFSGLLVYYHVPGGTRRKIPASVLYFDSTTISVRPVISPRRISDNFKITFFQGNRIVITVPFAGPYSLQITRIDGRIVTTINARKPAFYNFSGKDLKPGVYLVNVTHDRIKISKTMLFY